MKTAALVGAVVAIAAALPATAQQIREGRYHVGTCPAGISDGMITLANGRIEFWESSCALSNPVAVRDMAGAYLYDAQCMGEGQTWTRRYMLMPGFNDDLVVVGERWAQTYTYCGP